MIAQSLGKHARLASGLYIHIPFCLSKCHYCSFNSFPLTNQAMLQHYLQRLEQEIRMRAQGRIDSIYIGGGTPSLCRVHQIEGLLSVIAKYTSLTNTCELTMEINPGTVDLVSLRGYRASGINRLSIGIQSFQDEQLELIGRSHSGAEAQSAYHQARQAGFDNISLDLMSGLPLQTMAGFKADLKHMTMLAPEHISIYDLSLENNTPLHHLVSNKLLSLPDEDLSADMLEWTNEHLVAAGYEQYELSNYCQPNYNCLHNLKYWTDQEYLGLGLGAHSYQQGTRFWNSNDLERYLEAIAQNQSPVEDQEILEGRQKLGECLIMGLRLTRGIKLERLVKQFGIKAMHDLFQPMQDLVNRGLLHKNETELKLTPKGRMLANVVFRALV